MKKKRGLICNVIVSYRDNTAVEDKTINVIVSYRNNIAVEDKNKICPNLIDVVGKFYDTNCSK